MNSMSENDVMMLKTPFHSRIEAACEINLWGNWMGYTTPDAYFDVELEYFAVRSTTGVFDFVRRSLRVSSAVTMVDDLQHVAVLR